MASNDRIAPVTTTDQTVNISPQSGMAVTTASSSFDMPNLAASTAVQSVDTGVSNRRVTDPMQLQTPLVASNNDSASVTARGTLDSILTAGHTSQSSVAMSNIRTAGHTSQYFCRHEQHSDRRLHVSVSCRHEQHSDRRLLISIFCRHEQHSDCRSHVSIFCRHEQHSDCRSHVSISCCHEQHSDRRSRSSIFCRHEQCRRYEPGATTTLYFSSHGWCSKPGTSAFCHHSQC